MSGIAPATNRVIAAAAELGLDIAVVDFPQGTKTAAEAAGAVGCEVAAIVKSLVFIVQGQVEEPVLALIPGDRRLETWKLATAAGAQRSRRATLDEVREATGFVAGGTPPFGHVRALRVFADPSLRRNDPVWAAGGTPTTVFPLRLDDLERAVRPHWADIT